MNNKNNHDNNHHHNNDDDNKLIRILPLQAQSIQEEKKQACTQFMARLKRKHIMRNYFKTT